MSSARTNWGAAALSSANVPQEVMETLVATVHDNVDKIAGYDELRRRILGYDELQLWDRNVPLLSETGQSYTFGEAWALAMEFWRETFGEEFAAIAQQALDNRDTFGSDLRPAKQPILFPCRNDPQAPLQMIGVDRHFRIG